MNFGFMGILELFSYTLSTSSQATFWSDPLVISAIGSLIASCVFALLAYIVKRLPYNAIKITARSLPHEMRERATEEWLGMLGEEKSFWWKIMFSVRLVRGKHSFSELVHETNDAISSTTNDYTTEVEIPITFKGIVLAGVLGGVVGVVLKEVGVLGGVTFGGGVGAAVGALWQKHRFSERLRRKQ